MMSQLWQQFRSVCVYMEKEQVHCHDFSLGLFIHPAGAEDNKPKWHLINRVRNNRFEELRCRVEIIWQPGEENRNKEGWTFLLFPLSSSKQKFFLLCRTWSCLLFNFSLLCLTLYLNTFNRNVEKISPKGCCFIQEFVLLWLLKELQTNRKCWKVV